MNLTVTHMLPQWTHILTFSHTYTFQKFKVEKSRGYKDDMNGDCQGIVRATTALTSLWELIRSVLPNCWDIVDDNEGAVHKYALVSMALNELQHR